MYSLAIEYDALSDAAGYSVCFRFPSKAPPDAFQWLAADRQIDRGFQEPDASYIARLIAWLDLWRHAGSAEAILTALASYATPTALQMEHVKESRASHGTFTDWDVWDGNSNTHYQISPANWNWDNDVQGPCGPGNFYNVVTKNGIGPAWWRTWVIIYGAPLWAQDGTWADPGVWDDGGTWDTTATPAEVNNVQVQVQKWKSAASIVQWIIVAFDNTWFRFSEAAGSALLPDGNWGNYGRVEVIAGVRTYVPARSTTASYWTGVR